MCKKRYDNRFDAQSTEAWYRNVVLKSPLVFHAIRTDNAFAVTLLSCVPWIPTEFEANVILLCCDDEAMWEGLKCLRSSIEWARSRKCTFWKMAGDTDYDLTKLARRLGAKDISPRTVLRLL